MTTLGTLLTYLRDRLDEATAAQWTDPQLRQWIVEGARDIARSVEVLATTGTVTIVAGTQAYAMPTNMVRCYRAELVVTGSDVTYPLELRDRNEMDSIWGTRMAAGQGTPLYLTIYGTPGSASGTLYPTPSAAGTLTVYYYKLPVALALDGTADATNVDLPAGWDDVALDYAEYKALRKDRDARWQEARALYLENLGAMNDVTRKHHDQLGYIAVGARVWPEWLVGGG